MSYYIIVLITLLVMIITIIHILNKITELTLEFNNLKIENMLLYNKMLDTNKKQHNINNELNNNIKNVIHDFDIIKYSYEQSDGHYQKKNQTKSIRLFM